MIDRFNEVDTQVLGVSIDSKHSHKNWAESLGGVSYPLLQDFHPKGAMAISYGNYLENKGQIARSTVIVDKQGIVRYSALADGERIISELLAECKKINRSCYFTKLKAPARKLKRINLDCRRELIRLRQVTERLANYLGQI